MSSRIGFDMVDQADNVHVLVVHVYPTERAVRAAGARFSGERFGPGTVALCQLEAAADGTHLRAHVRFAAPELTLGIVAHEIHHATAAVYGFPLTDTEPAVDHFHHVNEDAAHSYSDTLEAVLAALTSSGHTVKGYAA